MECLNVKFPCGIQVGVSECEHDMWQNVRQEELFYVKIERNL